MHGRSVTGANQTSCGADHGNPVSVSAAAGPALSCAFSTGARWMHAHGLGELTHVAARMLLLHVTLLNAGMRQ